MAWKAPENACYSIYSKGENRMITSGYTEEEIAEAYQAYKRKFPYSSLVILKDVTKSFIGDN